MARDPDRDVEPAARDAGEEGPPPDTGTGGDELTDDSAAWTAIPPGAGGIGAGTTPIAPPSAPRQPRPVTPEPDELSPAEPRGFAVTAWVWLAAVVLAVGLGILIVVFVT